MRHRRQKGEAVRLRQVARRLIHTIPGAAQLAEPLRAALAQVQAGRGHRRELHLARRAQQVSRFDVHAHHAQVEQAVTAALDAAGLAWARAAGPPPPRGFRPLVASAADAGRLLTALTAALDPHQGWVVRRQSSAVQAFRAVCAPTGQVMAGPLEGCRILLWQPAGPQGQPRQDGGRIAAGNLLPPGGSSAWAPDLPQTLLRSGTLRVQQHPHVFEMTEPIDVVYTWVDDTDPQWVARRDQALREANLETATHPSATHAARFANHDELRYSLRSLATYAGWVRHIWLVTDAQRPEWLVEDSRLTVVDHREIFSDPEVLPVFNSHAIEANLHHIDGLAEHYLYLNDDLFWTAPAFPGDYFHGNGVAKFFPAPLSIDLAQPTPEDLPIMAAAKNNRQAMRHLTGREITAKMLHTPHPQRRSAVQRLEQELPQLLTQVSASRFRSPTDVSVAACLAAYAAYSWGMAAPANLRHFYVDLASPAAPRRLQQLLSRRGSCDAWQVACLNEVDTPPQLRAARAPLLAATLQRYFPLPSPWERGSEDSKPGSAALARAKSSGKSTSTA